MDDSTFNGDVTTIFWITLNILNAHPPPKKKNVFFLGCFYLVQLLSPAETIHEPATQVKEPDWGSSSEQPQQPSMLN